MSSAMLPDLQVSALPFDFYRRWTLSHPPPPPPRVDSDDTEGEDDSSVGKSTHQPHAGTHRHTAPTDEETETTTGQSQLSPFHHLVILLTRFACTNFPHLVPRVLFAEETMLPFVGWRTGGASWGLMREFAGPKDAHFRACWLGEDAYLSQETRRKSTAARTATTILYLHGGGFSLGSVSFYSEALLRLLNKVNQIEAESSHHQRREKAAARCIAVEYDLSPTARFPAPLLQCLRCYAYLVEEEQIEPKSIVFAGDSAGGNLAMAMLLALTGQASGEPGLACRDWSKLPLPGQLLLISPWADLRPKAAHAFTSLREQKKPKKSSRAPDKDLRDSMVSYDWDYVAAESLLHFAQLYAGVLALPRRVAGPVGWLSHLCGVLSKGIEAGGHSNGGGKAVSQSSAIDPARRLAEAVNRFLERPILDSLTNNGRAGSRRTKNAVSSAASYPLGLRPLFSSRDRKTETVSTYHELYVPFQDEYVPGDERRRKAADLLDHSALLSPVTGDWSKIQLERGGLVTWGQRERLSADIQAWVDVVHSGLSPAQLANDNGGDDLPCQDGQHERELQRRKERGAWLKSEIELGPNGVHAWPFVAMYLAGTEEERERGLDILASFVAQRGSEKAGSEVSARREASVSPGLAVQIPDTRREDPDGEDFSDDCSLDSPSLTFLSGSARSAAAGRQFTDQEYEEALGLGVSLHPTAATSPSSSSESPTVASTTSTATHTPWSSSPPVTLPSSPTEATRPPLRSIPSSPMRSALARRIDISGEIPRGRQLGQSSALWWNNLPATTSRSLEEVVEVPANVGQKPEDDSESSDTSDKDPPSPDDVVPTPDNAPPSTIDPSVFGLSYAMRRDAEGLSDIAEETSVLSASVTSAQGAESLEETSSPRAGSKAPEAESSSGEGDEGSGEEMVLSPDTRRFVALEAERQLASEMDGLNSGDSLLQQVESSQRDAQSTASPHRTPTSKRSSRGRQDVWWA